jgi:hypothetical protein
MKKKTEKGNRDWLVCQGYLEGCIRLCHWGGDIVARGKMQRDGVIYLPHNIYIYIYIYIYICTHTTHITQAYSKHTQISTHVLVGN